MLLEGGTRWCLDEWCVNEVGVSVHKGWLSGLAALTKDKKGMLWMELHPAVDYIGQESGVLIGGDGLGQKRYEFR